VYAKIKTAVAEQLAQSKARGNGRYVALQCSLLFASLYIILMMDEFFGGVVVASLGASSFILFATPHTNASRARNLVGSYIFGASSGVLFSYLYIALSAFDYENRYIALIVLCAVCAAAAALTMFLMVCTGLVHPPAAALAVGTASAANSLPMGVAAVLSVVVLCTVRGLLKKYIKNWV
jgi:CBS-domain-containing membrane protein